MMKFDRILNFSSIFFEKNAVSFDKEYFNNLPKFTDIKNHDSFVAENFLSVQRVKYLTDLGFQKIDEGGTRSVFALSSELVIKIAHSLNRIFGNQNEFKNFQKTKSIFFPKIFDHSDDFSWIVSQRLVPYTSEKEISSYFNIENNIFSFSSH